MPHLASLSQKSANISNNEDEHLVGLKDIDCAKVEGKENESSDD